MLKYITIIFVILMAILDYMAYRKLVRTKAGKRVRYLFSSFVITANAIPVLAALCMFVFTNTGNSTQMMKVSMISFTLFILFTLLRLFFYPFWLFKSSRKSVLCGLSMCLFTLCTYLYSVFVTRTDYEVKEVEICFANLPDGFDGYRVAFISDIHLGSMYDIDNELKDLASVIDGVNADILLFGGDLVNLHYSELTLEVLELLSKIKGKEGTYSVLGNHDTGTYISGNKNEINVADVCMIQNRVTSCGWVLLRDSTVYLHKDGDSIAITGVDYSNELLKYKHSLDNVNEFNCGHIYENVDTSLFNITVSHLPQLWYPLCDGGYSDLTLSGHIHAFQFKVSLFGYLFSPARFMYEEWSGLYEREKGKLYINDGIGTVAYYSRVGARPEVTLITLRKK